MRVFVGTFLTRSNQIASRRIIDDLIGQHPRVLRGIPDGSAHVTYTFVAETGDRPLSVVAEAIGQRAAEWRPFDVRCGAAEILPPGSRPRLVCLDIDAGGPELQRLSIEVAAAVRVACPDLECAPSKSPHVTIARFRKQAGRTDARAVAHSLSVLKAGSLLSPERIDHLSIVESTLTPAGPVYEIKARVLLLGGNVVTGLSP